MKESSSDNTATITVNPATRLPTRGMRGLLSLEEAAMFLLSLFLIRHLYFAWWWWLVWIMAPDLSALGYLGGNKVGAACYNIVHHKGVGIAIYILGAVLFNETLQFAGLILFGHSCIDRALGYGLKYFTGFSDTHLGKIGKARSRPDAGGTSLEGAR